jgi:hypothetical protein
VGDNINLMLAVAAFNFKKLLRQLLYFFILFWDGVSSANLKNMLYDTRQFDYGR